MKYFIKTIMPLFLVLVFWAQSIGEEKIKLDYSEISKGAIIGKLGVEIGRVVEVEGELIKGELTGDLALYGLYLFKVHSINGIQVQDGPIFEIMKSPVADIHIPQSIEDLIRISGKKFDKGITIQDMEILERDYVNKVYKIYCVENIFLTGVKFKDNKENYNKDIEVWAGMSYACRSKIIILKML